MMVNNSINFHLNSLNIKKNMTYEIGNPESGLGQAQNVSDLNRLMGSKTSTIENWISNGNKYIFFVAYT